MAKVERTTIYGYMALWRRPDSVKQPSVKFFGNIYPAEGVKADPNKIELRSPENKTERKMFLGMENYLQQFIHKIIRVHSLFATVGKESSKFYVESNVPELCWTGEVNGCQQQAGDYSKQGIGAALVQEGRPVQFDSTALAGGETDLAPIEGEILGVIYGIKKFRHYLHGRQFTWHEECWCNSAITTSR